MPRSIRLLAASALVFVTACSDGGSPEPPDGDVEGDVHLLGDLTEPPATGVVQLYASLSAVDQRVAFREAALAGGPANWTFHLENVPGAPTTWAPVFRSGAARTATSRVIRRRWRWWATRPRRR